MPQSSSVDQSVAREVAASLAELPEVLIGRIEEDVRLGAHGRADMVANMMVRGKPVKVVIEAKAGGFPSDLAGTIEQLRRYAREVGRDAPGTVVPLLAAPTLSPGGRELLRREGIAYWDRGGSLFLKVPWAMFLVDRPAPKVERRIREVYRGRTAQVLHALLLEHERWWGVGELAERSEVSPYTVHHLFRFLEECRWVQKRGKGPKVTRRLVEPGELLDAWAEEHSLGEYETHLFHAWAQTQKGLRRDVTDPLERSGIEYALALTSAAELVAPFGTETDRLVLLVPGTTGIADFAATTTLQPVEEGESVLVYASRERWPLLFRRRVAGCWVVSDVQLYLDLWAYPKRGKEQAQHLRRTRLGY